MTIDRRFTILEIKLKYIEKLIYGMFGLIGTQIILNLF